MNIKQLNQIEEKQWELKTKHVSNFIKSEWTGNENVENLVVAMVVQLYEFTKSHWVLQFNGWIM